MSYIYDSDIRADFGPSTVNSIWTRRTVLAIIGLNTAVFGAWQYASTYKDKQLKEWLQRNFTVSWTNINQGRYHTLLTSAFSHNQPMHFIFNMVTLHAFGSVLASSAINPSSLVVMSVSFGVLSSCALLYWLKSKGLDKGKRQIRRGFLQRPTQSITIYSGLGASGILCGLGAAATCLAPFQRMILAVIPMPLFMCTAVFFAVDTYFLNKESQVGHAAHLGGSVAGFAYYLAFLRNHGNGVWPMLRRLVVRR
ncbi:Integral membrane protease [Lecanosticta acicola]|uniref:Integral membrane protease n=1 Tax=Lecanosticta acicola TaxID=111012 RepID=A0AAI8YX25_9PEZI|nr:Integral membrane protease [Lecanosticta acicola]